jgi:hypothetical protein
VEKMEGVLLARASAAGSSWSGLDGKGCSASHLQMGHTGLREDSHWSMHSRWKRCLHGSTRSFSPSLAQPDKIALKLGSTTAIAPSLGAQQVHELEIELMVWAAGVPVVLNAHGACLQSATSLGAPRATNLTVRGIGAGETRLQILPSTPHQSCMSEAWSAMNLRGDMFMEGGGGSPP